MAWRVGDPLNLEKDSWFSGAPSKLNAHSHQSRTLDGYMIAPPSGVNIERARIWVSPRPSAPDCRSRDRQGPRVALWQVTPAALTRGEAAYQVPWAWAAASRPPATESPHIATTHLAGEKVMEQQSYTVRWPQKPAEMSTKWSFRFFSNINVNRQNEDSASRWQTRDGWCHKATWRSRVGRCSSRWCRGT